MTYVLGAKSKFELRGVHPKLVKVVEEAITITPQDFTVFDGLRTAEDQNRLYKRRASKLDGYQRKSMHQEQDDGYGHAVDLVPYINGRVRWEWNAIYPICWAMAKAAHNQNVPIRWGGFWGMLYPNNSNDLGSPESIEQMVHAYTRRRLARGKSAFTDGPHYEYRPDRV